MNLTVQNGLWLFKIPKKIKKTVLSTPNTTTSKVSFSSSHTTRSTISISSSSASTTNNSNATQSKSSSSSLTSNTTRSNSSSATSNTTRSSVPLSTSSANESNSSSSTSNKTKSTTSSSVSNTKRSITTTVISPDSSTDSDDCDLSIDDDKVSDGIFDDSGSDISSDNNNSNESSDCESTIATSSLSSSAAANDESNSPTLIEDVYNNDLDPKSVERITEEEEFISKALDDPTILLLKINILLKRVWKLVGMIHNTSNIDRYFLNQIKLQRKNSNQGANDQAKKQSKIKGLTLDMRIRWNSTFVMISRFSSHSSTITSLIHDPYKKVHLQSKQYRRLKQLSFTSLDWSLLKALQNVLGRFNQSTITLSERGRPTLALSQCVKYALLNYLSKSDEGSITLEGLLKKQLLFTLNYYFEKHVNDEQARATLVATFLDPSTYRYLACDDKKEAETIIINEAPTQFERLKSQRPLSTSQSSILPLNEYDSRDQFDSLKYLFETCGVCVESESDVFKPSTIKEEIAQYVATLSSKQTLSQYWDVNQDHLPILASFVRQYNVMCATSIDCESAFSVAGHIHRKSRSSLSPSTLRYTMLLREYYKDRKET